MLMRRVATINGVEVYSNKRVRSAVNTRVTFVDGSWCDVATGHMDLKRRCSVRLQGEFTDGGGNSVTIHSVITSGDIEAIAPIPPLPPIPPIPPIPPVPPLRPLRPLRPRPPARPRLRRRRFRWLRRSRGG
jgi:hypothetical protein